MAKHRKISTTGIEIRQNTRIFSAGEDTIFDAKSKEAH